MLINYSAEIKKSPFNFSLQLILALVFLFSAVPKILNPVDFAVNLNNYRLFPAATIPWLAVYFPWFELTLGVFLLLRIYNREALLLTVFNYLVFMAVIGLALYRGLDISCGCFEQDPAETSSLGLRLVEDFILLTAAVRLLWLPPGKLDK
jgi:hypothetical protein